MNGNILYSQLGKNGRLGNQLFQIAASIAYGLDTNRSAIFHEWEYKKYFKPHAFFCNFYADAPPVPHIDNTHTEPAFTYSPIPIIKGNVDINGYFQSYKYFDKWPMAISEIFTLNDTARARVDLWFRKNAIFYFRNYKHTCSIHVRRGDYADNADTKAYHGLLGMDYYEHAATSLPCQPEDILFVIVSDDIDWCRQNFTGERWTNVIFSQGNDEITDLFIQTCCEWNIIANSSFSWWGNYLNKHNGKICVAPKDWFAGAGLDTKDLYLPETIKV